MKNVTGDSGEKVVEDYPRIISMILPKKRLNTFKYLLQLVFRTHISCISK